MSEPIRLFLSTNAVKHTTISCDSLGIHYSTSENGNSIVVKRWKSEEQAEDVVGQFQLHWLKKDHIRLRRMENGEEREEGEWVNLNSVMKRGPGLYIEHARTFTASDGKVYTWKERWPTLLMTRAGEDKDAVVYHRNFTEKSYLEIHDEGIMGILDEVIVTFLIMEEKRRTNAI